MQTRCTTSTCARRVAPQTRVRRGAVVEHGHERQPTSSCRGVRSNLRQHLSLVSISLPLHLERYLPLGPLPLSSKWMDGAKWRRAMAISGRVSTQVALLTRARCGLFLKKKKKKTKKEFLGAVVSGICSASVVGGQIVLGIGSLRAAAYHQDALRTPPPNTDRSASSCSKRKNARGRAQQICMSRWAEQRTVRSCDGGGRALRSRRLVSLIVSPPTPPTPARVPRQRRGKSLAFPMIYLG